MDSFVSYDIHNTMSTAKMEFSAFFKGFFPHFRAFVRVSSRHSQHFVNQWKEFAYWKFHVSGYVGNIFEENHIEK